MGLDEGQGKVGFRCREGRVSRNSEGSSGAVKVASLILPEGVPGPGDGSSLIWGPQITPDSGKQTKRVHFYLED